jgi:hypothetical protein
MSQFVWLETGQWINAEQIIFVQDHPDTGTLVVTTTVAIGLENILRLSGRARKQLITFLLTETPSNYPIGKTTERHAANEVPHA